MEEKIILQNLINKCKEEIIWAQKRIKGIKSGRTICRIPDDLERVWLYSWEKSNSNILEFIQELIAGDKIEDYDIPKITQHTTFYNTME